MTQNNAKNPATNRQSLKVKTDVKAGEPPPVATDNNR